MAKLMVLQLFTVCYIRYIVATGIVISGVDCYVSRLINAFHLNVLISAFKKSNNFSVNFHLSSNVIACSSQHSAILVVLQSFILSRIE